MQFVLQTKLGGFAGKLRGAKFAGGKIHVGEADQLADGMARDGREKIIVARGEGLGIHGRAGRKNADDFALYQLFAGAGFFHLFADGHTFSGANQARDVALGRVVGHPAHRNGLALLLVAGSESDLQDARRDDRIVKKQLVEIAQAKKQQGIGMPVLGGLILPHQRRRGFGHRRHIARSITADWRAWAIPCSEARLRST